MGERRMAPKEMVLHIVPCAQLETASQAVLAVEAAREVVMAHRGTRDVVERAFVDRYGTMWFPSCVDGQ